MTRRPTIECIHLRAPIQRHLNLPEHQRPERNRPCAVMQRVNGELPDRMRRTVATDGCICPFFTDGNDLYPTREPCGCPGYERQDGVPVQRMSHEDTQTWEHRLWTAYLAGSRAGREAERRQPRPR